MNFRFTFKAIDKYGHEITVSTNASGFNQALAQRTAKRNLLEVGYVNLDPIHIWKCAGHIPLFRIL